MEHPSFKPLEMHTRAAQRHLFVAKFVDPIVHCWRAAVWGVLGRNPAIAREALQRLETMSSEGERAYLVEAGLCTLPPSRMEAFTKSVYRSPLIHRLFKLRMHSKHGPASVREGRQWKKLVENTRFAVQAATQRAAMRFMNPLRARAVAVAFAENYGPFLQALYLHGKHKNRALSTL